MHLKRKIEYLGFSDFQSRGYFILTQETIITYLGKMLRGENIPLDFQVYMESVVRTFRGQGRHMHKADKFTFGCNVKIHMSAVS